MVLETVVVCLDNSDYMRNGDFSPTRFQAQVEAVTLICGAKSESNIENEVGFLTMAGSSPQILVSPTTDQGRLLGSMHSMEINGVVDFGTSLQIAQLSLKLRQNKHHAQRVIAFVGSPLKETATDLKKLAAKLKKQSVSVDIVNFGEEKVNTPLLEGFMDIMNKGKSVEEQTCNLVSVPSGPHILADIILRTPIIDAFHGRTPEGGEVGTGGRVDTRDLGAAARNMLAENGVNPEMDPELAEALLISLEEEMMRQRQHQGSSESEGIASTTTTRTDSKMDDGSEANNDTVHEETTEPDFEDDQSLLEEALKLSMATEDVDMEMMQDDELSLAMKMSLEQFEEPPQQSGNVDSDAIEALKDSDFLSDVMDDLGVDVDSEDVQSELNKLGLGKDKEDNK